MDEDMLEVFNEVDDEDFFIELRRTRGPTKIRTRIDHFERFDEHEFFDRFRLHKRTANIVLEAIEDRIKPNTLKNRAILPSVKLLTTLRFFASGNFLLNIGELSGIHYSTASKIIKEVARSVALMSPDVIRMPSNACEVRDAKRGFYEIARFPNCVGALDCTHVRIQSPGGDNAEVYRNRKGTMSLNVQAVCDAPLVFRNIVARWPGSTHDSHIFRSSRLCFDFENGVYGTGVLVGDSGYACKNYLIPPLDNVVSPEERLFQESQVRTRNPIERCFGVWKRRFPVLALGIRLKIDRVESVIVATAVLHNICTNENEDIPPVAEEVLAAIEALEVPNNLVQRHAVPAHLVNLITRNHLVHQYFRGLLPQ